MKSYSRSDDSGRHPLVPLATVCPLVGSGVAIGGNHWLGGVVMLVVLGYIIAGSYA